MDFYVFQDFSSNVRKDLLANSWTPQNLNAKYPILDITDKYSGVISSYYVKDGAYAVPATAGWLHSSFRCTLSAGRQSLRAG